MSSAHGRERGGILIHGSFGEIAQAAEPIDPEYRSLSITEGFDWVHILDTVADTRGLENDQLYLVVFRSTRQAGVDPAFVEKLDREAHDEASQSDALLYYFAGELDDTGQAMSWCLWTDRQAALRALSGPAHQLAVQNAPHLYTQFGVELYDVRLPGERQIIFEPIQHPARH